MIALQEDRPLTDLDRTEAVPSIRRCIEEFDRSEGISTDDAEKLLREKYRFLR